MCALGLLTTTTGNRMFAALKGIRWFLVICSWRWNGALGRRKAEGALDSG